MARARDRRGKIWKGLRIAILGLVLLIGIPVVLVPVYWVVPPVSTLMIARTVTGQPVTRIWRDIDDVSDLLKTSVVLSEDGQFCSHRGIDLAALRAEIENFLAGEDARGASTITMQVARNLFLWNGRSVVRKALEVPLAAYIDLVLSKRRILEIYMNTAQFGPIQYGAEAGSQAAFGKPAADLSRAEALALGTVLPAPAARNPRAPGPRQRGVIAHVERELDRAPWVFTCLPEGMRP